MAMEIDSAFTRDEMVFGDPHHPCHLGITDTREDGNSVAHSDSVMIPVPPTSPDLEMLSHPSLLFLLPLHKFSSQQNLSSVVIAGHTHHGCDEEEIPTSS